METKFLTQKEAVAMLRTSLSTIIRWRKKGQITAYQVGGKVLYDREEIEKQVLTQKI